MSSVTTIATNLIDHFGYGGVALGLFINALGIPIPSELILPLAGIEVNRGHFQILPVFLVAVAAQVAALSITYAIARWGGVELVERYGKYVLIRRRELDAAERAFNKYGGRLVFFGLCLPAIHGYVGYPAGMARMKFERFLAAAIAGATLWTIALGALGYFLGAHLDTIDLILQRFGILIVVIIIAGAVWWVRRQRKPHDSTTDHAA